MRYENWTDALSKYWLETVDDGPLVLALEPTILLDVAETVRERFESAELAVESFTNAVKSYQHTLGTQPWRAEYGSRPHFLLLIAIQVYAASQMDDLQGHHTRNAYYVQLQSLVGDQAVPVNFGAVYGKVHRMLWKTMRKWAAKHGRSINLPSDSGGTHERNVRLPKSQAILRMKDLAELPKFFRLCDYQPDLEYTLERIEKDAARFRGYVQAFPSTWARNVLVDELRFPTACRQIHHELQYWDGEWEIVDAGRRKHIHGKNMKLWFAINRKKELLSRIGEAMESARRLTSDELANILSGHTTQDGSHVALHHGLCLCRFDSDDVAYKQVSAVEAGDRCLFAVSGAQTEAMELLNSLISSKQIVKKVCRYHGGQVEGRHGEVLSDIPASCQVVELSITDSLPSHEFVDREWHPFLKSPAAGLFPTGGLRLGREANWVTGAGPAIRIVGNQLPRSIHIDGVKVAVRARIVTHRILSQPGDHHVSAKIDGHDRACSLRVSDPTEPGFEDLPERAWSFAEASPSWRPYNENEYSLYGLRLLPPVKSGRSPSLREERQLAIRILANPRFHLARRNLTDYNHPLTRSLARIKELHNR